jgi:ubiquinone/menaquinone biosynthesis C-methylase UbiE
MSPNRSRGSVWLVALLALALAPGCGALKRAAYAPPGRDAQQQPERVVAALALANGAQVADLGAGGGYFTFRLADAVGPEGRVYAVDVDPDMLAYLRGRVRDESRANVEVVEAAPDDSRLPDAGVDLVFLCNTYHHLGERVAYFERLRGRLRPGGRVAIVEYRTGNHGTDPAVIAQELEAAGYRRVQEETFLSEQSFLVFTPSR